VDEIARLTARFANVSYDMLDQAQVGAVAVQR
jgi:predicted molibdopterin-dependent oxidoreductase YjgC